MSRGRDESSAALGVEPWQQLSARVSWDDLVLPEKLIEQLRGIPELYRERPRSESAGGHRSLLLLFGGPSGGGKSSAARALAGELGRSVLEADVEGLLRDTEHAPHLVTRLFNEARQLGGVLVLDRADALLRPGRNGSGPELNERAAGPLLRLDRENYRLPGIVIFCADIARDDDYATRLQFDRRFIFPVLDAGARAQIWHQHLPPGHSVPEREIAYLGQAFRLSGKAIAGCCALAARRAAGRPVSLHDIADQLDAEYEGRLASDWTRAALAEVRSRAEHATTERSNGTWTSSPMLVGDALGTGSTDWAPAPRRRAARRQPMAPGRPRRLHTGRLMMLGVVLAGAIAAVALGVTLSNHRTKTRPPAVTTSTAAAPTAEAAYKANLAQALGVLNRARTGLSRELGAARTPAAQAQAAQALASAHLQTASALVRLDAGRASTTNQNLVIALRNAAVAYGALAHAAQGRDPRAYAKAANAVSTANASVSSLVARVRALTG